MRLPILLTALLICGCSHFSVVQIDETPNKRVITTKITGQAWFSSSQSISKIKAQQTDKTQSFGTDQIGQTGATNTAATIMAITELLKTIRP